MHRILFTLSLAAMGSVALSAAPLVPRIDGHDFNFGAWEPSDTPFYDPRGLAADFLTLAGDPLDREVTAYWEIWPVGGFPLPIFNSADQFGGDFQLFLEFDGEDAAPPHLDVSLTGSGRLAGADLFIWGKIPALGIVNYELLTSIDIRAASLYGYGGASSFVLETFGYFEYVNPLIPGADELVNQSAVSRGNIDFQNLQLPSGYHPLLDYGLAADGGGYSGEVGRGIPEPSVLMLLGLGAAVLTRRLR